MLLSLSAICMHRIAQPDGPIADSTDYCSRSPRLKPQQAMDVTGEVTDDLAVLPQSAAPLSAFAGIGHGATQGVTGSDEGVVGSGSCCILSKPICMC